MRPLAPGTGLRGCTTTREPKLPIKTVDLGSMYALSSQLRTRSSKKSQQQLGAAPSGMYPGLGQAGQAARSLARSRRAFSALTAITVPALKRRSEFELTATSQSP